MRSIFGRNSRSAMITFVTVLSLGLASCNGGGDGTDDPGEPTESTGTTGTTGATGESGESPTLPVSESTVVAVEYEFEISGSFEPGPAEITLENEGEEQHELALSLLDEGRTIQDVEDVIAEGVPDEPPPWITTVDGTFAEPGQASEPLEVTLEPGTYLLACFVTNRDGVPHAALGMLSTIEVEG